MPRLTLALALLAMLPALACKDASSVVRSFPAASIVLFQPDFESREADVTPTNIYDPYGNVAVTATRMYVPDYTNSRIMAFDAPPTTNGQAADFVLGQTDFVSDGVGTGASELDSLGGLDTDGTRLVAADYGNARVLVWDTLPTTTAEAADRVLGQSDFGLSAAACTATGMDNPETAVLSGTRLVVADSGNNRVLIWNTLPTTNGQAADLVIGQADFTHCTGNDDDQDDGEDATPTARTLAYPSGVFTDGTRLAVLDRDNNRVLIWETFPTSSFEPADIVLGQASFTAVEPNDDDQNGIEDDAPSARTLGGSTYGGPDFDGDYFCVTDGSNNRVLVWDGFPTTSFQPADLVIGQSTFAMSTENDDDQDGVPDTDDLSDEIASARTVYDPTGCELAEGRLWVTDYGNSRILGFDLPL